MLDKRSCAWTAFEASGCEVRMAGHISSGAFNALNALSHPTECKAHPMSL